MKKRVKKEDKFNATEVGALIEDLKSQFRAFGEGISDLREKLDTLTGMVAENSEKVTWLRLETGNIKGEIVKVNGKLARIEEGLRPIKDDLKLKVDHKDFEILEKKVASFAR